MQLFTKFFFKATMKKYEILILRNNGFSVYREGLGNAM